MGRIAARELAWCVWSPKQMDRILDILEAEIESTKWRRREVVSSFLTHFITSSAYKLSEEQHQRVFKLAMKLLKDEHTELRDNVSPVVALLQYTKTRNEINMLIKKFLK